MGLYKKLFIMLMLTLFIVIINDKTFYGGNNVDMFNEILKNVESSTEEYVVEGSFYSDENKEDIYNNIVINIEKVMGQVNPQYNGDNSFEIDYNNKKYSGCVSMIPYKGGYNVVLNISICGFNLEIEDEKQLRSEITEVLSPISSVAEYSLYVKSKILSNTIDEVKDEVLNQLKIYNAQNIDEVKISNGYSIISNTNLYEKKVILGKDIDFNCAIVKYSSGCYLIMGTPEIKVTY